MCGLLAKEQDFVLGSVAPSIFFTGSGPGSSSNKKEVFKPFKKKFKLHSFFLTRKISFIYTGKYSFFK